MMPPLVLVTGGAGYLGSHVVSALSSAGYHALVLDNLSGGNADLVLPHAWALVEGAYGDGPLIRALLEGDHPANRGVPVAAVVHCASERFAGAGMAVAAVLCQRSLDDMEQLLAACVRAGDHRAGASIPVVYASDASVYGSTFEALAPLDEQAPLRPCTAAGYCHWMNEQLLLDYRSHHGLPSVILRRFCVAGADPTSLLGEDHVPEHHLLPSLFEAMTGRRAVFELYGSDYPTPDGTCLRDLVHVRDVAQAHVLAVTHLLQSEAIPSLQEAYNLGTGRAVSILQVIERAKQRTGCGLLLQMGKRRHGDSACLLANSLAARRDLGWRPRWSELNRIVDTAWQWHQLRFANDPEQYALAQSSGGLKLKPLLH